MADHLLAVRRFGTGPPLVALHGFTLTGAQFAPLANHLDRSILAPDLPGHGGTTLTPIDLPTTIDGLARMLGDLNPPVPIIGYSMGARIALSLALDRPDLIERIVIVSAGPGIEDPYARTMRAAEDEELADRIRRMGMARFLDEWLTSPVTSTTSVDEALRQADRVVREENTTTGLIAALHGLGQGASPYLGARPGELAMPLLTVSGGKDVRYTEQAAGLTAAVPDGRHTVIPGAGHNVVLEAPEELGTIVQQFLSDVPGG
jgi:2-succinyl-6-hydroxy-2,4-cyclohexadiene-1-carboxylate synthase